MVRKVAFVIVVFALGLFGVIRLGRLPARSGAYDAVAWAQDSASAAAAQDNSGGDVSEELNTKSAQSVAGFWCGSVDDNVFGFGTISLEVKQNGKRLHGSWSDTIGGSGKFKGKINGDAITAKLMLRGTNCKVAMVGTLVSPNEATGTYSIFGCHQSDGGTFDITSPSC